MATPTILQLDRGSIRLLGQVLNSAGWSTTTSDSYRAGELLESPEFELPKPPAEQDESAALAWTRVHVELPISAKQRETARKAVEHFVLKAALTNGRHTNLLLRALGLAPED